MEETLAADESPQGISGTPLPSVGLSLRTDREKGTGVPLRSSEHFLRAVCSSSPMNICLSMKSVLQGSCCRQG